MSSVCLVKEGLFYLTFEIVYRLNQLVLSYVWEAGA
jgi:hypothetical protein